VSDKDQEVILALSDYFRAYSRPMEMDNVEENRDLDILRREAAQKQKEAQVNNEKHYNKKKKEKLRSTKNGDFIMV